METQKFEQLKKDIQEYCNDTYEYTEEEGLLQEFIEAIPIYRGDLDYSYICGLHGYNLTDYDEEELEEELTEEQEKELKQFIEDIYDELNEKLTEKFTPKWHFRSDFTGMDGETIINYEPDIELIEAEMEKVFEYNNQSANCLSSSDYYYTYGTIYFHKDEDTYYNLKNEYSALAGWNCSSRQWTFEEISESEVEEIREKFNIE